MSRIPGTADAVKRIDKNSLFTKTSRFYNQQRFVDENFLLDSKNALDLIDPDKLSEESLSIFIKRLDDYNGYFSTQQIENIDFNKFENHIFFDSAVSKVSYSFNKILNDYPYDKSEFDYIQYINSLDGYTKFILDNKIPHFIGCIKFSNNIKISIVDKKGSIFNDYKPKLNENVFGSLDPKKNRFSFNFWLKSEDDFSINNQVVFKKLHNNSGVLSGFICYISLEGTKKYINFKIVNETSETNAQTEIININSWNNININVNNSNNIRKISFLINNMSVKSETQKGNFSVEEQFTAEFNKSNFVFGNAESVTGYNDLNNTFIDEFKYFNRILSQKNIKSQYQKNIFSQRGLKLYLKFNESDTDYSNNYIVLDSSGNKLHGKMLNTVGAVISSGSVKDYRKSVEVESVGKPLKLENKILSPTIFPNHPEIISNRKNLIETGEKYDKVNPNIIFNLIPKYYFLENSEIENLPIYSNNNEITYSDTEGLSANSPANNHLVNILSIWARFFDQLKMYIDSLVGITNLDYENMNNNYINGTILPIACKKLGFDFKELLSSPNKSKLEGNKLTYEDIVSANSLRQIQNSIWKRLLINSKDYVMSKGTKNSIKSIFNSFGIKHDNFFTLREYSDLNLINLTESGKRKNQHYMFLNFLDFENLTPTYTPANATNLFSNNLPHIQIEKVKSRKNNANGFNNSWELEIISSFDKINLNAFNNIQNLIRINEDTKPILNLYFERKTSESEYYNLVLDFFIMKNNTYIPKNITIEDINIFEGVKYISISQKEIDYSNATSDQRKGSDDDDLWYEFELNIKDSGYVNKGRRNLSSKTTVKFVNSETNKNLFLQNTNNVHIHSGPFKYTQSNDRLNTDDIDTTFQGKINCIRLWAKKLSKKERKFHALDLKNIGEDICLTESTLGDDAGKNIEFNFQFRKEITSTDINNNLVTLKSFYNTLAPSCFAKIPDTSRLDKYNNTDFVTILENTLKIDEPDIENKVSILSYSDDYFKEEDNNFYKYPIHEIPDTFNFQNDKRFSVELSNVKFLNEDISKLISSTDHFSNSIINSTSMYSYEYNKIKEYRNNYFKRLENEIDHKILLNFFKYFDNALQDILTDSIPTNVGNTGFNFIYESHSLERHKYEYKMSDNRVSIVDKDVIQDFSKDVELTYRDIFQENKE